tara:strand:+ start:488 stop:802 length:315 start_codon:yes stop_codon:yes gene_type:complete
MKNVIQIWKNKGQIIEGVKNNIFKKEHIEDIAEKRLAICEVCSLFDKKGDSCLVPGTQPCCGSCGCSMDLKLRALSSECPEGKWNAVLSHEENYLLTQQIKKND